MLGTINVEQKVITIQNAAINTVLSLTSTEGRCLVNSETRSISWNSIANPSQQGKGDKIMVMPTFSISLKAIPNIRTISTNDFEVYKKGWWWWRCPG
jgi:hypothetical protein